MGICELLTAVFIVLRLCGVIGWNWWLVLLPEIVAAAFYSILIPIDVYNKIMLEKIRVKKIKWR